MTNFFEGFFGRPVIIRTNTAGVHFGTLEAAVSSADGFDVKLKDSRRIYGWAGAFTLSELAVLGTTNPSGCKLSVTVGTQFLRAIEIIPMEEQGIASLTAIKPFKP